jgi:hypothetical protein
LQKVLLTGTIKIFNGNQCLFKPDADLSQWFGVACRTNLLNPVWKLRERERRNGGEGFNPWGNFCQVTSCNTQDEYNNQAEYPSSHKAAYRAHGFSPLQPIHQMADVA